MCSNKALEKIEIMLDRIEKIYQICKQYGSPTNALQDELLAQPAIMKNFDIMYEQIEKLGKRYDNKRICECYFRSPSNRTSRHKKCIIT